MNPQLANFASKAITEFRNIDGEKCYLLDYLHSHALYASKRYVYLTTKSRSAPTTESTSKTHDVGTRMEDGTRPGRSNSHVPPSKQYKVTQHPIISLDVVLSYI
jgi:hypothetical protein